jgi:hypothetical protein
MTKKEFALAQIAPYFVDPSTCGYNKGAGICKYITGDGRMCVLGKNLLDPHSGVGSAYETLGPYSNQKEVLKLEAVDILSNVEWRKLQRIHDELAMGGVVLKAIKDSDLFTTGELDEYVENLKSQS